MKFITGLLVGAAVLASGPASAQYYTQTATVSGLALSYGPDGFMLAGPDGNYGIVVDNRTVTTDAWGSLIATGPGIVQPGDWVTATGYPTSQWTMRATQVVERNAYPRYSAFNG